MYSFCPVTIATNDTVTTEYDIICKKLIMICILLFCPVTIATSGTVTTEYDVILKKLIMIRTYVRTYDVDVDYDHGYNALDTNDSESDEIDEC